MTSSLVITVIICTYNRPKKVAELVGMLLEQKQKPDQIIVVDSSDEFNDELNSKNQVDYIRSSHKNQPYQRYLGYLAAKHDWLLYLDDDMEPINDEVLGKLKALREKISDAVAFAIQFENLHEDTSLASLPKSQINKGTSSFQKLLRWLTSYPELAKGKVGWNGVRGRQPNGGFTEWFSGGAFLAKKEVLFQDFNFGLFTMFEKRIGMGEDYIIAYSIAQRGKVWATEKVFFYHNDQKDSTYTVDVTSFNRRVIYSRLYLSLEKSRLTKHSKWLAVLHYHYYSLWRGMGMVINILLNPSKKRLESLQGFISGFLKSYDLLSVNYEQEQLYWMTEASKDIS